MSKTFNTRIKNKIDSIQANSEFIPLRGEIMIGTTGTSNNTNEEPYLMKIGDGSTPWKSLPSIGPNIFKNVEVSSTEIGGTNLYNQEITIKLPSDRKGYGIYKFGASEDYTFSVKISCEDSNNSYMEAEHYLLLDNREGLFDKKISSVSIEGINTENIFVQDNQIMIGEIAEMKISIWRNGNNRCATIVFASGIINGGDF